MWQGKHEIYRNRWFISAEKSECGKESMKYIGIDGSYQLRSLNVDKKILKKGCRRKC